MNNISLSSYLYGRLPEIYRIEDARNGYVLRRYIDVLCKNGLDLALADAKKLSQAYNIDKVDLAGLKRVGSTLGYEYINNFPEDFQRRLIKNLIYLYKIKGTIPAIKYIAKDLTGYLVDIEEQYEGDPNTVHFQLTSMDGENTSIQPVSAKYVKQILKDFVPANINPIFAVLYSYMDTYDIIKGSSDAIFSDKIRVQYFDELPYSAQDYLVGKDKIIQCNSEIVDLFGYGEASTLNSKFARLNVNFILGNFMYRDIIRYSHMTEEFDLSAEIEDELPKSKATKIVYTRPTIVDLVGVGVDYGKQKIKVARVMDEIPIEEGTNCDIMKLGKITDEVTLIGYSDRLSTLNSVKYKLNTSFNLGISSTTDKIYKKGELIDNRMY